MAKHFWFFTRELLMSFLKYIYIPTTEKLSFHIAHVRILGSIKSGKTRNDFFHNTASKNNINLKKDYAEKFSKKTGIEIQSQYWKEIGNYQWKIFLLNIFQIQLIQVAVKQNQNFIHK